MDSRLHYVVAGAEFRRFHNIAEQTGAQIYLPNPITLSREALDKVPIHITAPNMNSVNKAKALLQDHITKVVSTPRGCQGSGRVDRVVSSTTVFATSLTLCFF